jgi:hypothetical protein
MFLIVLLRDHGQPSGSWLGASGNPCDTAGIPYPGPGFEGMAGMHIERGHFNDLTLNDLTWVVTHRSGSIARG